MRHILIFLFPVLIFSCKGNKTNSNEGKLFTSLTSEQTGISFQNQLDVADDFDVFRYRNYYNGGGVAIGDINNDGLPDIYLVANTKKDKLFLNQGNFKFKDITESAGVGGSKAWSTGVAMADVNGDGLLDIYVCNSGNIKGDGRGNELFINNGNLTFTEKANEFGLVDGGFSTHAAFFDYDKDGDLDCYLLNNSFRPISTFGNENTRHIRDELGGHKLYENDNGKFVNVSEQAGIYGSVIGFGLGVTVGDVNHDGWMDIYVSNDFFERDYLYINNHNKTFTEKLTDYVGHVSAFSMGADLADLNNDGMPDIFSTDMLPVDDYRVKTVSAYDTYEQYKIKLKNDYYHQYMRNMLQINNGDNTFSEVAQMTGVAATDWSWGSLIADFDNDGNKEIFVSNGIYKDVTDQDYIEFMADDETIRQAIEGKKIDFKKFVDKMPSHKLSNFMFKRDSGFHFTNLSTAWGLDEPSFSNGAAYGDLDNDGDLDLIVNNVNQEAFVYRNNSEKNSKNNYLSVDLVGEGKNSFALGANIKIFNGKDVLMFENIPTRGFESSMNPTITMGLGKSTKADSLVVTWPNGKVSVLVNVKSNQRMKLFQKDGSYLIDKEKHQMAPIFNQSPKAAINFRHKENNFSEFDRERLVYNMLSTQGPALETGDLNKDGLDDVFIGGARGQASAIFIQRPDATFERLATNIFDKDSLSENVDALFFDADNDSDLDIYVVTGGSEALSQAVELEDHLYINSGGTKPTFTKSEKGLPSLRQSGSCARTADFDHDGDLDLFVGTRAIPGYYGMPPSQYILQNDGKGNFRDVSNTVAPDFKKLGLVTDAQWFDYDRNGFKDLIIVGEWMAPTIFINDGKHIKRLENRKGLEYSNGWWNAIKTCDIDRDGDTDFVLGNIGWNSKFQASRNSPISLYISDFDQNGSIDPIFTFQREGTDYPIALKQDIVKQIPSLRKKFIYNKDYANKSIDKIFDTDQLKNSSVLQMNLTSTVLMINNGNGFDLRPLPWQAQTSPVFGIEVIDVNKDGNDDIVMGGNLFAVKPEAGRYDAMHGLLLLGDGHANFTSQGSSQSGILIKEEVRKIKELKTKSGAGLLFGINNDYVKYLKITK